VVFLVACGSNDEDVFNGSSMLAWRRSFVRLNRYPNWSKHASRLRNPVERKKVSTRAGTHFLPGYESTSNAVCYWYQYQRSNLRSTRTQCCTMNEKV
jgi:transposase